MAVLCRRVAYGSDGYFLRNLACHLPVCRPYMCVFVGVFQVLQILLMIFGVHAVEAYFLNPQVLIIQQTSSTQLPTR